eukprot:m.101893 g.101893  ORF g.101893 m.101893 type:complete len:564 (+) comp27361_c0_seq2:96-1787(+)
MMSKTGCSNTMIHLLLLLMFLVPTATFATSSPRYMAYNDGTIDFNLTTSVSVLNTGWLDIGIEIATLEFGEEGSIQSRDVGPSTPDEMQVWLKNDPMQTHEVYYMQKYEQAYLSIISTGQIFGVSFDADGNMMKNVSRWTLNANTSGTHNIAGSRCHEGYLWVSTQYDNSIHLIDPKNLTATPKYSFEVPRRLYPNMSNLDPDTAMHISEPHSVIEAPDCSVWVSLKGNTRGLKGIIFNEYTIAAFIVLDSPTLSAINTSSPDANETNLTQGFAVWHVHPDQYNASTIERGGKLYPASAEPVMCALDGMNNTFCAQDNTSAVFHVAANGEQTPSIDVLPWSKISGPGAVMSPDGSVWVCALTENETLIRFRPGSITPEPFVEWPGLPYQTERRTIHLAFHEWDFNGVNYKMMYILTSSLMLDKQEDDGIEEVIAYRLNNDTHTDVWNTPTEGDAPLWVSQLPYRHMATHRIAVCTKVAIPSLLVSGLFGNRIYQLRLLMPSESSNITTTMSNITTSNVTTIATTTENPTTTATATVSPSPSSSHHTMSSLSVALAVVIVALCM